jgi:acyl-CoA synthetase (AMP-forming)/AMP-acid ligase II
MHHGSNGIPYKGFGAPGLMSSAAMWSSAFETTYNVYFRMNELRLYDNVLSTPIEPAELFDFFKTNLPYFAIPRYVDFLDALPRNGVGRVMKHKLREAGNTTETWDFEALDLTVAKEERR